MKDLPRPVSKVLENQASQGYSVRRACQVPSIEDWGPKRREDARSGPGIGGFSRTASRPVSEFEPHPRVDFLGEIRDPGEHLPLRIDEATSPAVETGR